MNKNTYTVSQYIQQNLNQFKRTLRTGVVVAFMFTAVAAQSAPVDSYQSRFQLEPQTVMTLPSLSSQEHFEAIDRLSALNDNWDGEGAVAPNPKALENSRKLLSLLSKDQLRLLSNDDIYASSYGSIVMDFETHRGLVSVEMGDTTMGVFTDFPDEANYATEGIKTDFETVPEILQQYLS